MSEPRHCPKCGAALPGETLDGLCPQCMARVVFGEGGAEKPPPQPVPTIKVQPDSDITIERTDMRIGRYKLLEQIGEGGFGVVYMAEQIEPVQRKVALKIVKAGMDFPAGFLNQAAVMIA